MSGRRRPCLVAIAAVLVGCGGGGGRAADGGIDAAGDATGAESTLDAVGPLATPRAFCLEVQAELGVAYARCYGGTAQEWSALFSRGCDLDGAFAAHRLDYDRAAADACLATLAAGAASTCPPSLDCYELVVKGSVAVGQACDGDLECGPGGYCLPTDVGLCSPTTCVGASPSVGQPCTEFCGRGAVCGDGGVCVPFVGLGPGEPCDDLSKSCALDLECRPDPTSATDGRACRAIAHGLPCVSDGDCPWEDFCDATCKPRLPLGASCAEHPTACFEVGRCDAATKTCMEAGHVGEPCGLHGECFEGFCDFVFGSGCLRRSGEDAFCVFDSDCLQGAGCAGGKCLLCPP